jgi:hypothetical protein
MTYRDIDPGGTVDETAALSVPVELQHQEGV